jgi:predicted ABC-class ATPase
MCQKQHGAAFRSRTRVSARDFRWIQGEDLVTFYESTPAAIEDFAEFVVLQSSTNSMSGHGVRAPTHPLPR